MKYLPALRIVTKLAGVLGTVSMIYAPYILVSGKDSPVNPVILVLAGLVLMLFWIYFSVGYKRAGFHFLATVGTMLVIASLNLIPQLSGIVPFKNSASDIAAGFVLLLLCRYVSTRSFINMRRFLFGTLTVTGALLFGLNIWAPEFLESGKSLVYGGEIDAVLETLSPYYKELGGEAEKRIKKILEDNSLSKAEKERLIEDLNSKINELEEESKRLEEVKKENEKYKKEIARLKERVKDTPLCPGLENNELVRTFSGAVHSKGGMVSPCVRDFAVKLASEYPGSYYARGINPPVPGTEGVHQIIAVHRYVASQWKYVNDPLSNTRDYFSPADRTLALGLAGDCDDFAILLAASIEAIGGKVRILGGTCSEGGHAWCEVYIGDEAAWNRTVSILESEYTGIRVQHLMPRNRNDYWLSLDWQIGNYSCSGNPVLLYN